MQTDRTEPGTRFAERLVAVEPLSPQSQERLEEELHAMFVRELTTPRRMFMGAVGLVALGSAAVCGFLASTEPDLPLLARVGLATGTLFGLAWTVVAARVCWRGAIDIRRDSRRMAIMVWVFTVLMMVLFLMVGMSVQDRLLGIMMIANGLAFLIGAAVYWLSHRIEQAELATREKLLQLELRLAEISEKR
jgi:MFS family permease